MKVRNGFVSNSSSSSFVIKIGDLTPWQLEGIRNHSKIGELLGLDCWDESWSICEDSEEIEGSTSMDNFDMDFYIETILRIDSDDVVWRG